MKVFSTKNTASILFFLSLIICAVFIVLSWKKDLVIYPGNSIPEWNTDKILFNRNTETHFFEDHGDSINVSFTLQMGDSDQYPFCLTEFLPVSGEHFDISGYDYVNIEIHSETASKATPMVRANIQVEIPGYSEKNNRDSYRIMWFEFPYVKGQREYNLPIEDFITPGWWWTTNKSLEQSALGKPDYRKVSKESAGCSPNQYRKKLIKKPLKS